MLVHLLGVLGVVLNVTFAWPQVWRARRTTEGIALGTVVAGYVARLLWTIYAVRVADLALLLGQAPVALGFFVIACFVFRYERGARPRVVVSLAAATAAVFALTPFDTAFAAAAVVVAAAVNLPQMVRVLANRTRTYGVSPAMYWLISAASATWLCYGFATHDLTISAPHFLLLPTGLVTAVMVQRRQAANRSTPGP